MKSIGIDIGGTQLRVAIFDEEGKMIESFKTDNDRSLTASQNMDKLLNFVMEKAEREEYKYRGIGIGCPGPLDTQLGTILNPPNLVGWDGFGIVSYVKGRTGLKTVLNNDANVAGLSEALLGAGSGYESVVYLGLSTGIGGAYVYRGELVNGANSNAAEFWNMMVNDDPYHHKSANAGSLNEQASGSALERLASAAYGAEVSPKELFARCRKGDEVAWDIVERAADVMARGLANITCTIDPDLFIIGGSVAIFNPDFVELIEEKAREYVLVPNALHIEKAKFGDDAGLIGASLLV